MPFLNGHPPSFHTHENAKLSWNVHLVSQAEDILEEYKTLRDEDAFTDMEIVAGGRGRAQICRRRMHSVVMAASSDFLGHWMEQVLPLPAVCSV